MSFVPRWPCDEGVLRSLFAPGRGDAATKRWVLAAAILGSSLAFIDGTVVNVALPVLQESLGASAADAQWVVESYALCLSSLILVGGVCGDRFGRRRVFLCGTALFAVASIACGLASDVRQLVVARAVQGVGGALLVPGSLSLIGATFSAADRGRAIGTWSAFTPIATAVGPLAGGWLVEKLSWRAVFFINLPLALAVIAIALARVPESRDPDAPTLDLAGAALATLGLSGLTFGLIASGGRGFGDMRVAAPLAVGACALVAFPIVQRWKSHPMVPPSLFRSRTFTGANLLTLLLYAALIGVTYFLPFVLIQGQAYSPTEAGAAFLPFIVILFALSRWSGGLVDRIGPRGPLIVGPLVAALGIALLALPGPGARYWTGYFPGIAALGLGMAITIAPLTTTVMNSADPKRQGLASGVNNAVARVAGLLAIAVLGLAAGAAFNRTLDRRLERSDVSAAARAIPRIERAKLGAARPPNGLPEKDSRAVATAIASSLIASFRVVALLCAGLALLASLTSVWLLGNARSP